MRARIENAYFNEDGIPNDPHLTNEYYKNCENDFENEDGDEQLEQRKPQVANHHASSSSSSLLHTGSNTSRFSMLRSGSPTRNSMSKTVVPNRSPKMAARATTAISPNRSLAGGPRRPLYAGTSKPTMKSSTSNNALLPPTSNGTSVRQAPASSPQRQAALAAATSLARMSAATRVEYDQLIDVMQNALTSNKANRERDFFLALFFS